ncbi:MAG: amino acid permease, partial [Acidobacteriota bacterium]
RGLGLIAAVSVIIGNVIGTGVFLKARVMTCNVGTPWWVILAWVAAGILSLAGALTYAELTAMKPQAGGEYVFLRDAYGKVSSFLFGWMQMLIAKPGSQAAASMAFAIGLNDFLGNGALSSVVFYKGVIHMPLHFFGVIFRVFDLSDQDVPFEITLLQVTAVMVIIIFTTLNCASVSVSGQIATVLTGVKIALILFVTVGAFIWVTGDFSHFGLANTGGACEGVADSVRVGAPGYSFTAGFAAAMLGALWGYDGWNNLTFVAGEVKDPNRNIPLAIIGSTILVIVLYVIAHIGYFYVLDPTTIASVSKNSSVGKTVVSLFFGGGIQTFATGICVALFTFGLMLSSLGTLHTSILAGARVPYAMAQDGLMFRTLGKLSVTGVPVKSLIVQGIWACILALSGSFDTLTDYVIFGSWIFYALVTSSIFVFRIKHPDLARPYKAWGYPVIPILFLLVAGWLLITTLMSTPTQSFIGIFLIILGLPVYYYLTRSKAKSPEASV